MQITKGGVSHFITLLLISLIVSTSGHIAQNRFTVPCSVLHPIWYMSTSHTPLVSQQGTGLVDIQFLLFWSMEARTILSTPAMKTMMAMRMTPPLPKRW